MIEETEESIRFPEHAKLKRIRHLSQEVANFLDWLVEVKEIELMEREFGLHRDSFVATTETKDSLLHEYFEIDAKKISTEKDLMLEDIRNAQKLR